MGGGGAGALLHQEGAHELVQVAVKDGLGVGGAVSGAEILHQFVGVKDIGTDL